MRKTKKTAIVAGTTVAVMGAGIAFAAWTSNGTGTGSATAGQAQNLTVTADDVTGLFPSESKVVTFTVKNNNSYKVAVDSLVPTVAVTGGNGCTVANSLVTATTGAIPTTSLAKDASLTIPVTVAMGADSDNGCQGAKFTVTGVASSHSVA